MFWKYFLLEAHRSTHAMSRINVKELIKQGNLTELEELVLQGNGDRLLGESSSAPLVQEFLDNLPNYLVNTLRGKNESPKIYYLGSNQRTAQSGRKGRCSRVSIASGSTLSSTVPRSTWRYSTSQSRTLWTPGVGRIYRHQLWSKHHGSTGQCESLRTFCFA